MEQCSGSDEESSGFLEVKQESARIGVGLAWGGPSLRLYRALAWGGLSLGLYRRYSSMLRGLFSVRDTGCILAMWPVITCAGPCGRGIHCGFPV